VRDEIRFDRQLFGELSGTAVTTAVIILAGVVTGSLSARVLGPTGRGELAVATIWPATLLYAGTFGLPDATAYLTAARPGRANDIFLTAQTLAVVFGAIVSLIGWALLPILLSRQSPAALALARAYLLAFSVPCLSSLCACAWLQGAGLLKELNIARAAVHVTTAVLMAILAVLSLASVGGFVAAMLVGNAATAVVALAAWGRQRRTSATTDFTLMPSMLAYGTKVQVGSWSATANLRLDQLMLASFAASTSLGLYVVAVSYAGLVVALPAVAGTVMLPRLVRDCVDGTGGATLTIWFRRVLWSTLVAGFCLWMTAGLILPMLFGSGFHDSVSLVAILVPASCVVGMNQFLSIGFRGHGRPGVVSRAEIAGLSVTVPLLAILLPKYGIYGAAVTSLCAYSVSAVYLIFKTGDLVGNRRALWFPAGDDWLMIKRVVRTLIAAMGNA
jgi:enterobacterial common antigen flippase